MPRSRYLILTAVPPGDGRSADVELTARRRPSDRTITEMGNAKRSAKNITISMAGASATPASSRLHGTSAQWTLFQSPSIQMNCWPS
jgi:hypothetical protein